MKLVESKRKNVIRTSFLKKKKKRVRQVPMGIRV